MPNQQKFATYVWELPVRWCHWINMLCIVILSVTGFFIGTPFSFGSSASAYTMGWIRFIHFVAAYTFTASLASRVVWSLMGNEFSGWRAFFPFLTTDDRRKMLKMLRYYMFVDREVPETIGHNPLATTAYLGLFSLYLVMALTGFTMYFEHAPGGVMHEALGFMSATFSHHVMRQTHHMGMWLIVGFVINHIYSAWLMDIKERGGEISSIFSGYKFTEKKED